ncbi:MAG: hypothetical protein WDZ41_01015 [Candidatus Babeliales bacterium]
MKFKFLLFLCFFNAFLINGMERNLIISKSKRKASQIETAIADINNENLMFLSNFIRYSKLVLPEQAANSFYNELKEIDHKIKICLKKHNIQKEDYYHSLSFSFLVAHICFELNQLSSEKVLKQLEDNIDIQDHDTLKFLMNYFLQTLLNSKLDIYLPHVEPDKMNYSFGEFKEQFSTIVNKNSYLKTVEKQNKLSPIKLNSPIIKRHSIN